MYPVGGLKNLVMNTEMSNEARGHQIDYFCLDWVCRWRYSTEYALLRLWIAAKGEIASRHDERLRKDYKERHPEKEIPKVNALLSQITGRNFRKKLNRLVERGLLNRFDLSVGRTKYAYRITKAGLQKLQRHADRSIQSKEIGGSIKNRTAAHDIGVQLALISRIAFSVSKGELDIEYATEKEFSTGDKKGMKRPDVTTKLNGRIISYEIELSGKTNKEIHQYFARNENLLQQKLVNKVQYYFSSDALKIHYERILDEQSVPVYVYDKTKRRSIISTQKVILNLCAGINSVEPAVNLKVMPALRDFM